MPFGGLLSLAGPLLSIGGGLAGMINGSPAQQVQMPQTYNYQSLGGADNAAYGGIGQLANYNVAGNLLPQYQQIAQNTVNNPYAGGYVGNSAATGAAGMGSGAGITGTALSQLPDVQALMALGFDPQNSLYSKLQNQNQQQNQAILGQSGVASTPYGAGVAADANSNFNINWQNQQLQRALQGSQGASSLLGSIGQNTGTGLNQMAQGAALPYQAYNTTGTNALQTLSGTGQFGQQASALPQQQIQDYLQYLSQGTQQQGANNQTGQLGLNQANSAFQQNQAFGSGIGQGLGALSKGWGNTGFGGGGNLNFGSWGQNNPGISGSAFYGPVA